MKRVICVLIVTLLCGLGCVPRSRQAPSKEPKKEVPLIKPEEKRIELTDRVKRARALVESFKGKLQSSLRQAIKEGGPVNAISVCSDMAPEITDATRDGELWLRRVGTRVRNAELGTPTARERELLGRMTLSDKEHVYETDDTFHYMQGIFIDRGVCVMCHGPEEQIPREVKTALAQNYPDDKAIGYEQGDLRGAFVVYGRGAPAPAAGEIPDPSPSPAPNE